MKVLVFDTETTGLVNKKFGKYPSISNSKEYPYVVQLSFILYCTIRKDILVERDFIIKIPSTVYISPKSTEIHRITNEMSQKQGISMKEALSTFMLCANDSHAIVAHNIDFDKHVLQAEAYRNQINDPFAIKSNPTYFDTMVMGKSICNIRQQHIYTGEIFLKSPKLIELYKKLFNQTPKELHNSLIDIVACLRCFVKIYTKKDIYQDCYRIRTLIRHE